jgi:hypothetical protein
MVDIFKDANAAELYDDVDTAAPPPSARQSSVKQMIAKGNNPSSSPASPAAQGGNSSLSMALKGGNFASWARGGSVTTTKGSDVSAKSSGSSSVPLRQTSVNSSSARPVSVNLNQGRSLPQTPGAATKGRPVSMATGQDAGVTKESKEDDPPVVNVKDLRKMFQ